MKVYKIIGRLKALSPIFHGGNEKTGNVVLLNRLKFIVGNKIMDIPIISGNQVRGRLRRLIMNDFLERLGYKMELSEKSYQKLYHTLFAGGVLTEATPSETGVIDLTLKKKIVDYILPLRLLGCSYSNQMIEGRLLVGHMLPICKELKEYVGLESNISVYEFITRAYQTRRDELRVGKEEEEESVQMIVEYEVFAPGTEFYHEIILRTTSEREELDLSTLHRMIELWKQQPFIGGKSSIGFGKLAINYEFPKRIDSKPYLEFIEKNRDKIIDALEELRNRL